MIYLLWSRGSPSSSTPSTPTPTGNYTQINRSLLRSEILNALGDPSGIFWTADEVDRAINESLYYWGLLTSYWRERGQFTTTPIPSSGFYDLSSQLPTLRPRTFTLDQIITEIQYHLLEPATGYTGTYLSDQFNIDTIRSSVIRARNQFILDSQLPISITSSPITPSPSGRSALPQTISLIHRAGWQSGPTNIFTPLRREDTFSAQSSLPTYPTNPDLPIAYSLSTTRPIEIELIPPPSYSGLLHLLATTTSPIHLAGSSSLLLPDEFAQATKYLALHWLLGSDSEAYDPLRSKYCLERYTQWVDAAKQSRSILRIFRNSIPLPLDGINALDSAFPNWPSQTGTPTNAACAFDILALSPVADGLYSLTTDLVRCAPVPTDDFTMIQLGAEEIPYLISYCRHILSIKLGGSELAGTAPLFEHFLSGVEQRNGFLSKRARYLYELFNQPKKEQDVEQPA